MGGQVEQGILNYEVSAPSTFDILHSIFNILFFDFCTYGDDPN
jgi:hypothetical protein